MRISGRSSAETASAGVGEQVAARAQRAPSRADRHRQLQGAAGVRRRLTREFRQFLHQLAGRLTAFPAASLWVGEYDAAEIALPARVRRGRRDRGPGRRSRTRAAGHAVPDRSGSCAAAAFLLRPARLPAHRRGPAPVPPARRHPDRRRLPARRPPDHRPGSPRWTRCWAAACGRVPATMIAGPSGSGKTLMGLHFIFGGARQRRARRDRHPAGEPHPAAADARAASAGR